MEGNNLKHNLAEWPADIWRVCRIVVFLLVTVTRVKSVGNQALLYAKVKAQQLLFIY